DRALNNEMSLDVMRNCSCPVLGVVPGMPPLPMRVLAATDFSDISFRAMRMAREVAGHGALFMLAYAPPIAALLDEEGERLIHDLGVRGAFAKAIRNLGDDGITFDHVVLEHDIHETTAGTLLAYAEQSKCDLVTAGSARLGRIERWMIGSVSTELIRDGSRSVLIVPPERTSQRS
ncbi:MAG: universal stress protein, partial [Gemmatimonadaceae bacterium]|nr:universal stress protein [Gemmatimonadaceae bacterium]